MSSRPLLEDVISSLLAMSVWFRAGALINCANTRHSVIECLARGAADLVHHEDRSIIVGDDIVECESALIFWHETFLSIGEK